MEDIQVFSTIMRTPDNKKVIVPNAQVTGSVIINYSANDTRRVDLVASIGYGDDIGKAREVLQRIAFDEVNQMLNPGDPERLTGKVSLVGEHLERGEGPIGGLTRQSKPQRGVSGARTDFDHRTLRCSGGQNREEAASIGRNLPETLHLRCAIDAISRVGFLENLHPVEHASGDVMKQVSCLQTALLATLG